MKHMTFRIRRTQHRNVAACQLHNHLLSTAVPYDCFCLVPKLHIPYRKPDFISTILPITDMRRLPTFRSPTDRIYESGPIKL